MYTYSLKLYGPVRSRAGLVVVVVLLSLPYQMPAKIGRGASGGGSGRLQAALARGGGGAPGLPLGGAPGGRSQQLVDAIIELGHLPTQSENSTLEEKQLAVRLIKACNAGSLSSKQLSLIHI